MKDHFTYSILQYKHSLLLNEAINIGVVFCFSNANKDKNIVQFVYGNAHRAKLIYPGFDNTLFNVYLKTIEEKIIANNNLFQEQNLTFGLGDFLHQFILAEDDSALQFSSPIFVSNSYKSSDEAIKVFSQLLLPGIDTKKPILQRKTESLIIKKYRKYISEIDKSVEEKLVKKPKLEGVDTTIHFDFAWQNGSLNYVKTLSFDLKEASDIEKKAFLNAGQLNYLTPLVVDKNIRFDYIVASPSDKNLFKVFDKALKIIQATKANFRLVEEDKLELYSKETILGLKSH